MHLLLSESMKKDVVNEREGNWEWMDRITHFWWLPWLQPCRQRKSVHIDFHFNDSWPRRRTRRRSRRNYVCWRRCLPLPGTVNQMPAGHEVSFWSGMLFVMRMPHVTCVAALVFRSEVSSFKSKLTQSKRHYRHDETIVFFFSRDFDLL